MTNKTINELQNIDANINDKSNRTPHPTQPISPIITNTSTKSKHKIILNHEHPFEHLTQNTKRSPKVMKKSNKFIVAATAITFVFILSIPGKAKCLDGFISHSIGKRGACSHHGGVSRSSGIQFPLAILMAWLVWYSLTKLTNNKTNANEETKHSSHTDPDDLDDPDEESTAEDQEKTNLQKPKDKYHINKIELSNTCPRCGSRMVLRVAKKGKHPGTKFWGCSRYPKCRGTRELEEGKPQIPRNVN